MLAALRANRLPNPQHRPHVNPPHLLVMFFLSVTQAKNHLLAALRLIGRSKNPVPYRQVGAEILVQMFRLVTMMQLMKIRTNQQFIEIPKTYWKMRMLEGIQCENHAAFSSKQIHQKDRLQIEAIPLHENTSRYPHQ